MVLTFWRVGSRGWTSKQTDTQQPGIPRLRKVLWRNAAVDKMMGKNQARQVINKLLQRLLEAPVWGTWGNKY